MGTAVADSSDESEGGGILEAFRKRVREDQLVRALSSVDYDAAAKLALIVEAESSMARMKERQDIKRVMAEQRARDEEAAKMEEQLEEECVMAEQRGCDEEAILSEGGVPSASPTDDTNISYPEAEGGMEFELDHADDDKSITVTTLMPTTSDKSTDIKTSSSNSSEEEEDEEVMVDDAEAQVDLNEQEQDFFDQHNVHCQVCNQPGEVLCCATCNLVFHVDCVRPKLLLEDAPNDWMCAYCCVDGLGGKNDKKEMRKATHACREMERMTRECEIYVAPSDETTDVDPSSSDNATLALTEEGDSIYNEVGPGGEDVIPIFRRNPNRAVKTARGGSVASLHTSDEPTSSENESTDDVDSHSTYEQVKSYEQVESEDNEDNYDNEDDKSYKDHKDDEDDEDDEDHEDHEDGEDDHEDDEDDDNDDDVGTFSNEVEGGVPCAPHTTWIKRLHILNQTPTYRRTDNEENEIKVLIENLIQMKSRGEIGGKPCGLGTCWTYNKKAIGEHRIGRMVGCRNSFKVYPEIICTGNAPSLSEVINAIKRTKGTKIGKNVSIIEVPGDVLEHCDIRPFAQNANVFITSRFELVCGLKNENGELEMFHMGVTKGHGRKSITIHNRMFVDRLQVSKCLYRGRFGLMCFSANRDKSDWNRHECDHMNGDPTDDRDENVRWLTPAENKSNYNNTRARRSHSAQV
jgi:hypothetical protein